MTTTTTRTRKRRTRRKIGPTPDQQPRRSHPAVDVSRPDRGTRRTPVRPVAFRRAVAFRGRAFGARRRRLYRKRWAPSRGRPAARATTPGSPSPAFLDNSRRLLSHSCASIYRSAAVRVDRGDEPRIQPRPHAHPFFRVPARAQYPERRPSRAGWWATRRAAKAFAFILQISSSEQRPAGGGGPASTQTLESSRPTERFFHRNPGDEQLASH